MQGSLKKGSFVQMDLELVMELLVQQIMAEQLIKASELKLGCFPGFPPHRDFTFTFR